MLGGLMCSSIILRPNEWCISFQDVPPVCDFKKIAIQAGMRWRYSNVDIMLEIVVYYLDG
jgi:hypothetical protein